MASILILGAGFGGLAAANILRSHLPNEHTIAVIDKDEHFMMGLAKLGILVGKRTLSSSMVSRALLAHKGIEFVNDTILRIEAQNKVVKTATQKLSYDYLIISLGAELAPQRVKGFQHAPNAYNLYGAESVAKLHSALQSFKSGKIVLLIASTPFKCPAAPYEAAFLLHDYFSTKGFRNKIDLAVITPEPQPMPVAGKAVGEKVAALMRQCGIRYLPNKKLVEIDGELKFDDNSTEQFDLLIVVPPHRVPTALIYSGFASEDGWVAVDSSTLKASFENVYAIGDCAAVKLPSGASLPKAGVFAEKEAEVVANRIIKELTGNFVNNLPTVFSGEGSCYLEVGGGKAAYAEGKFFQQPPLVVMHEPSEKFLHEKAEFERSRIEKWFY